MKPARTLFLGAALAAAALLSSTNSLFADDAAPQAPAASPAAPAVAPAPAADAPKTADAPKPETKTSSPIHSMLGWVAKQVAPNCACGCPSTDDGGKAWRSWFEGPKDVPLASLRDALVADGWNADRTISYFKQMASKQKADGACAGKCEGKCDGKCEGKCDGKCDGKPCCDEGKKADTPAAPPMDKPADAPKLP